ncbi:MAG: tRNA (adenosine(37)-N6)-threonylcarbamoyltransferase complex dimerization subunit type 1 TsaB [Eubacterium sp.]|nr:tRNA (adenosine(37)-N6)-threonylcarbamoyltransferase complex dimerization subunit type 1 TsaB [Eubacterium sp.]MDD7208617.1 tRNA (adenosine(37)-N6)-threonylcarbamoyltransferase complex dimerization subunit type 1 TsaB [Lachnospiraceae bacterium]MDY5497398.1 tRNA (adenosine(37)-N6)-threonylcarbamoyltransferase complex dimerization subunit type 1 TsaB [Anaerobutyricum sp.]
MKLLALDSSGLVASAAILENETLIAEYTVNYKKTHSQTLLPMVDEIVKMTQTDLNEIDAIAVAAGPGSFTGLRIGSATAKGLGLALNKPIVPVPTLEGLACNFFGTEAVVCPMMDARRKQVYTGLFRFKNGTEFEILSPQEACPVEEILCRCNEQDQPVIFLGDGVPVYREIIEEMVKTDHFYAPAHLSRQRAGAVGVRAITLFKEGKAEEAGSHAPIYLRKSQAERELLAKGKKLEE